MKKSFKSNLYIFNIELILILIFIFFCQNLIFPSFLGYTNDQKINIDDSIKLALLNSRKLQIAQEELNIVNYKTSEALSYRYPKLDFLASYGKFDIENEIYLIDNDNGIFLLNENFSENFSTRFNLTQILYRGAFSKNIKKTSNANIRKAKNEQKFIRNNIVYSIRKIFNEYLFFIEVLNFYHNLENNINALKKFYIYTKNNFTAKESFEFDIFLEDFFNTIDDLYL
ncbi:MAG: TolC family protein, partial [Elusimicrobiota bacterium]|nr:TolC family protein [Elusimicrobiota bacterium]